MDKERWDQIEKLFHAASQVPSGEQEKFLASHCAGDESLRREVQELLDQRSSTAFAEADRERRELIEDFDRQPTATMIMPGSAVGPYQIEGPLGKGGMGVVYRARDSRLGRPVALIFIGSHHHPGGQSGALST